MIKQHLLQNSFSSGEVSPWLNGRTDIEQYLRGAAVVENFDVRVSGGLERRVGTKLIGASNNQVEDDVTRVQEFAYSRDDALCVEIIPGFFYFYQNGVSQGSYGGVPFPASNGVPFSVAHTYLSEHINELQFSQSADVMFITHPLYPIHTLSRHRVIDPDALVAVNAGAWTWDQYDPIYGPYIDQSPGDENTSLTLAAIVDRLWLTTDAADFGTLSPGDWVEYAYFGQKMIGLVIADAGNDADNVLIEPVEERCLLLTNKVHSPGKWSTWDATNSIPVYTNPISSGTPITIAFSATAVVSQETVGNYLRFMDIVGGYWWMFVSEVGNIVEQGAYGILATGTVLSPRTSTGNITRRDRTITGTLTSSDATFFNLPRDTDRLFRCVYDNEVVHCRCTTTAAGDYQTIAVTPHRPLPLSNEGSKASDTGKTRYIHNGVTTAWNKGSFYTDNYPSSSVFHEGRFAFSSTPLEKQNIWFSRSADFINFAATNDSLEVTDAAAINLAIDSNTVNEIMWLSSRTTLLAGTSGGEWNITGTSIRDPITPTTASARNQSAHGSEFLEALTLGLSTLFLQKGGNTLRQIVYSDSLDQYEALDLTVFSDHILRDGGGAIDITYQRLPEPRVIITLADGAVAVLVYEPDQQVYAWSRYRLGGSAVKVISATAVRRSTAYDMYFIVERTSNAVFTRTLEYAQPETKIFLDSYIDYSSAAANIISSGGVSPGLAGGDPFQPGDEVAVWMDGAILRGTLDGAGFLEFSSLPETDSTIYVGYPYSSILQSLPLNPEGTAGTSMGKPKRINRLSVKVKSSAGFQYGVAGGELYTSPIPTLDAPFYVATPSGDVRCDLKADFNSETAYVIIQDEPLPLSILSVMPEVTEYN